jgi:hypothetical protein
MARNQAKRDERSSGALVSKASIRSSCDPLELRRRQGIDQPGRRPLARAGSAGETEPLDHPRAGGDDPRLLQPGHDRRRDRLAPVLARCRGLGQRQGERQVGAREGAQPEPEGQSTGMLAARLVASRVIGPGGRRNVELTREPSQQALGRVLLRAQAEAWVSQEAELDRRPEPVGSAATSRQPVEIGGRERAMPNQGFGVGRHAEQAGVLVRGQELPAWHRGGAPRPSGPPASSGRLMNRKS